MVTAPLVIDTNVIVSALLNRNGNPAKIFDLIGVAVTPLLIEDILTEYHRVLAYPRLRFSDSLQVNTMTYLLEFGKVCVPTYTSKEMIDFVDETDRKFYDLAVEYDAFLVTGNMKHFPNKPIVMTPKEYLERLENNETTN